MVFLKVALDLFLFLPFILKIPFPFLSPLNLFLKIHRMNLLASLVVSLLLFLKRHLDFILVLDQLALVSFLLLTLDSFHFAQERFHFLCSFSLVQPIVLFSELEKVFYIGISFSVY